MDIRGLQRTWDSLGREDPLWAVLSDPEKRGGRWDVADFMATGVREIDSVLDWLKEFGVRPPSGLALDFGCGVGRLTQPLAERIGAAVGVDIAPSMIDTARSLNQLGDRCRYELNTRDDLSLFPTRHFDLVYSNITLQHMPPALAKRYIAEMIRVLRSEGVLVFQLPSSPPARMLSRIKRFIPPTVRAIWRNVRQATGGAAHIQMYWMAPAEVEATVTASGGRVIASSEDFAAGPGWSGKRYAVRRAFSTS